MTSLGIVVGVSEYNAVTALPACKHDSQAVAEILRKSDRFDEVLHLTDRAETASSFSKNRISELADRFRGQIIDEVFFYFSGHGNFDGTDFRYLLSDYSNKRPNQTSLSNTELDGILRGLSPRLFVKIVDACNSGISYIKGEEDLSVYLKDAQSGFNSVYFMFSSQSDEVSYASKSISFFTRSILKAIKEAPDGPVRYRDLMSAASDDFSSAASSQTPKFVVQANNTEVFCESSESMRMALDAYLKSPSTLPATQPPASTLVDRIRLQDSHYCSKEEAEAILEGIADSILHAPISTEIEELFEIEMTKEDGVAPKGVAIGSWLDESAERGFFARPTRKSEEFSERVAKNALAALINPVGTGLGEDNWTYVKRIRQVVSGYRLTATLPFGHLVVNLLPKFKPISPFRLYVAPIISRNQIVIFWRYVSLEYSDWEKLVEKGHSSWVRSDFSIKDEALIISTVSDIWSGLHDFIITPLLEQWPDPSVHGEASAEEPSEEVVAQQAD